MDKIELKRSDLILLSCILDFVCVDKNINYLHSDTRKKIQRINQKLLEKINLKQQTKWIG